MKLIRVLIVDDNPAHAEIISACLSQIQDYRCEVLEARHADEARQLLADEEIDITFLDYRLGAVSGLDLLRNIRQCGDRRPVIVTTAHGDEYVAVDMIRAGADEYLCKPDLSPDTINKAIGSAMARAEVDAEKNQERDELTRRLLTLTRRERDVLKLIIQGLMNKQIAAQLHRSEKTIKIHRSNIMHKMKANTAAELVRMVMTARLSDFPDEAQPTEEEDAPPTPQVTIPSSQSSATSMPTSLPN